MASSSSSSSSADKWLTPERLATHARLDKKWEKAYERQHPMPDCPIVVDEHPSADHSALLSALVQATGRGSHTPLYGIVWPRATPKADNLRDRWAPIIAMGLRPSYDEGQSLIRCYYYSFEEYDEFAYYMIYPWNGRQMKIPDGLPTPKFLEKLWGHLGSYVFYMVGEEKTYTISVGDQETMEWVWTWFPLEQRQLWAREWRSTEADTHGAKQLFASFRQYCSLDKAMSRVTIT